MRQLFNVFRVTFRGYDISYYDGYHGDTFKRWIFIPPNVKNLLNAHRYDICHYQSKHYEALSEILTDEFGWGEDTNDNDFIDCDENKFCIVITNPMQQAIACMIFGLRQKYIDLENIVVEETERGQGLGSLLIYVLMKNANNIHQYRPEMSQIHVNPGPVSFYTRKHGGGFQRNSSEECYESGKYYELIATLPVSEVVLERKLSLRLTFRKFIEICLRHFELSPENDFNTDVFLTSVYNYMLGLKSMDQFTLFDYYCKSSVIDEESLGEHATVVPYSTAYPQFG
ncbi:MAG: hypothetical protein A3F41_02535 [Coxiella sp. RIFCSPHIGHO2_12_FULL_44_14]|nr:MAG: hypothetical protein A3F41_02535 [Coxiella sp. RIFCSPHIGHO2_12_FULL_44_14]